MSVTSEGEVVNVKQLGVEVDGKWGGYAGRVKEFWHCQWKRGLESAHTHS